MLSKLELLIDDLDEAVDSSESSWSTSQTQNKFAHAWSMPYDRRSGLDASLLDYPWA
jgi:hypothetical protein